MQLSIYSCATLTFTSFELKVGTSVIPALGSLQAFWFLICCLVLFELGAYM